MTDIIEGKVDERLPSFATILIDTGAQADDLALSVVQRSDILIAPFMDTTVARKISAVLEGIDIGDVPLYGLKCGDACKEAEHPDAVAAFKAGHVLLHGLPRSPLLANMSNGGHLLSMHIALNWKYARYPQTDPARKPLRDFIKIKSEIGCLANEIGLALDGYELRRREPFQRQEPISVYNPSGPIPT
ncbi:hypothetical protein RA29_20850 [Tateyamaria sp. ANG-S1]|nr:hypothetical protein RA29_20850 [Tateyamaria sp. ANG-S1]